MEQPRRAAWDLRLFGGFRLCYGDGQVFHTRGKRHRSFIAIVALQEQGEIGRKLLASTLFDDDELPALQNLRLLTSRLTTALRVHSTAPLFNMDKERVVLNWSGVRVDVAEFIELLRQAGQEFELSKKGFLLAKALACWEGDLAPELDHPVITTIRDRVRRRALKALLDLARSPVAEDYHALFDEKLALLEPISREDPALIGNVMKVLAALGRKERLIELFAEFESWLDDEFGETPNADLCALFERLVNEAQTARAAAQPFAPLRPDVTIGRSDILESLVGFATTPGAPRVLTLVGLSGIGKSHLLAEAYWRIEPHESVQLIDCETVPEWALMDRIISRPATCLLMDHADHVPGGLLEGILKRFPKTRVVLTSHRPFGLQSERVLLVPPLDLGPADKGEGAVGLLRFHAEQHLTTSPFTNNFGEGELAIVAALCDGIPLALELSGKFMASAGFQATVQALETDALCERCGSHGPDRHQSVGRAIHVTLARLTPGAKRLVMGLSFCQRPCHAGLALRAFGCTSADLQESLMSGLLRRQRELPVFNVPESIGHFVRSTESAGEFASCLPNIAEEVVGWYENQSVARPIDLSIAASLGMAFWSIGILHASHRVESALRLLGTLKYWLGSEPVGDHEIEVTRTLVGDFEAVNCPHWPKALLALAALHFHSNHFVEMDALVNSSQANIGFRSAQSEERVHLQMQRGLAKRMLGDNDQACLHYRDAIAGASNAGLQELLVKSSFNLAILLENLEKYQEALQLFIAASEAFGPDTDIRVENHVNSSIARLQHILGHDIEEVCRIYEATLTHAMERDDKRVAAEILQNLGAAYAAAGDHRKSCLSLTIGTALLLDYGYTDEFRRLARSAFVVLGHCLLEIGEDELMRSARTLVDRLGETPIFVTALPFLARLEEATYRAPKRLKYGIASEEEVASVLRACYERVSAEDAGQDAARVIEIGERFARLRLSG